LSVAAPGNTFSRAGEAAFLLIRTDQWRCASQDGCPRCLRMSASIKVLGVIRRIEPIAVKSGIRELAMLRKLFGRGRWRKLKGEAYVQLPSGHVRLCEVHWYEAHGIGKRKLKIKRFLNPYRYDS
jgi:hypothetical protein